MRKSLVISAILHLGVLACAIGIFPVPERLRTAEVMAVPVDLVTPTEFTKIKAGLRDSMSLEPAKAPKKKSRDPGKRKTKAKTRAVKAAAKPPAKPKPKSAPKTAKAAPPARPKKRPKRQIDKPALDRLVSKALEKNRPKKAKPRAAAKRTTKSRFDSDRIAALLNMVPDAGAGARVRPKTKSPRKAKGRPTGRDQKLTISEIDALRARISQCWTPPTGVTGADALRVRLRLNLNRDGTLARQPEILDRGGSAYFQVAADSAVRAVWQCQPYQLPGAKYALWRDMVLNFDPREMFGG